MPKNKKESFVFTVMMCTLMVLFMSTYNVIRIHGLSEHVFRDVLKGFPLGFIVALAADWFVVGPVAKKIAFRFMTAEDSIIKKILLISSNMVTGMVVFMSLFGAVIGVGLTQDFLSVWLVNIPLNFIVAFPLQLLIVGPVTRYGFSKIYGA